MRKQRIFSVIIPTLNEGVMLDMTVNSILKNTEDADFEVVIVDDGSTDGSCDKYLNGHASVQVVKGNKLGVAKARNLGASFARGDYLVFLDAHCRVSPNWLRRFAKILAKSDIGVAGPCFTRLGQPEPRGAGMTWLSPTLELCWFEPHVSRQAYEVPFTPGGCQAFRRDFFTKINGYDQGFGRWGSEDIEVCLRSWMLGHRVAVDPNITIEHDFRDARNFEVHDHDVAINFLRLIHMHFSAPRVRKVLKHIAGVPGLQKAMDDLYQSDVFERRENFARQRVLSDEWFCQTFIPALV